MIKWIKRAENGGISFCSPLQEWTIIFEAFINNKIVLFSVKMSKEKSFVIHFSGSNRSYAEEYFEKNTNRFVVTLEYSKAFIDTMKEIDEYEKQMKERIEVTGIRFFGKMDSENYVARFHLISPVSNNDSFSIINGKAGTSYSKIFDENTSFFLFFKKCNDKFVLSEDYHLKRLEIGFFERLYYRFSADEVKGYEDVLLDFLTHQNFLSDVLEFVLEDEEVKEELGEQTMK